MMNIRRSFVSLLAVATFSVAIVSLFALSPSALAARSAGPTPTPTPVATPAVAASPTPEPDEVIRFEIDEVNLNVRVVDRNNRSINGLKMSDFRVFEDGVEQELTGFSTAEVPTNYALVIDNSGSLRTQLEKVIEASKILVATNKPADETALIRFVGSDKITIEQPFTNSKSDLNDSLENLFIEGGQTAIIDAVYLAVEKVDEYEKSKKSEDRKRRAIVLVSDGEDRDSYYNEKQLFDLLRESEVQIYVVGFVGELTKEGGFISKSPQAKAKAFLDRLATESGGRAYFPNDPNELPELAQKISSELRTQYVVNYRPSNESKDGKYRTIKVSIADGPGGLKRIPVTRTGRIAGGDNNKPTLQKPDQN